MTAARMRLCLALGLVAVCTAVVIAAAGAATSSTRYKIASAVGSETVVATGKATTSTGVPATYSVKFTMTWKASGAGQYGTTSLSKTPASGQKRLCSSACPTIGPLAGKVVVTGALTPTDGKTPKVSCAVTKKLGQIFPKGSTGNYRTIEFYKQGHNVMSSIDAGQIDYAMQQSVKDPACKFYGSGAVPYLIKHISSSAIGASSITVTFSDSKKVTLSNPPAAKATVTHKITVKLVRY